MEFKIGLSNKKEEQPEPTMRTTLGGVGVKVIGGERFDARMKRLLEYYEELFKVDPAMAGKMSEEKKWILEQVYKRLKFIFGTGIPWGYPMDNKNYSDAVEAVIDLLLLAKNLALSRTSNQTALLISHDYFSRCDILVGKSFGRENTALDTPIIVMQPPAPVIPQQRSPLNPTGGMGGGPQQPDMNPVSEVVPSRPKQE